MNEPTRIVAIRHGETTWNVDTRIQGHLDIPLNATGRQQAARMARALQGEPIAAVYASDLTRAWETAGYLGRAQGLDVTAEEGLRERGFGDFEGKTFAEIEALLPDQSPRTWTLGNAAINRLLWTPEGFTLVGWADTEHLNEDTLDDGLVAGSAVQGGGVR